MRITLLLILIAITQAGLYQKYYEEALTIAKAMSFDQKIGQAMQVDFEAFKHDHITDEKQASDLFLGSLLVGGNGAPD